MLGRDARACSRQRHGALDFVAKLTHVARPVVFGQQIKRRRFEARDELVLLFGRDGEEAGCQKRDVLAARA